MLCICQFFSSIVQNDIVLVQDILSQETDRELIKDLCLVQSIDQPTDVWENQLCCIFHQMWFLSDV